MIKGLSDRRRLPRLGRIKLGVLEHTAAGKPYPRACDYFVCPPEIQAVHGERPRELPVMFPSDDPAVLFPQELKAYKRSGLFCAGDGETARRWGQGPDGKTTLLERACPCEMLERGECKPSATLNLLLPDVPGVGVWQITTASQRSIVELNTAFEQMLALFGGLRGIPFTLSLEVEHGQRPGEGGQMVRQDLHVLHLSTPYTLRQIVEWRQRAGKPVEALMPAPEAEDEDLPAGNGASSGELTSANVAATGPAVGGSATAPPGRLHDHGAAPKEAGGDNQAPPAWRPAIGPGDESTVGPLFSQAGSSEGERVALTHEVGGSSPPPPATSAPWDISMAYRSAAACGIGADLYGRWLVARYGKDADNVTATDIAAEEAAFGALKTAGEQLTRKAEIVKAVNEALRRREGTGAR